MADAHVQLESDVRPVELHHALEAETVHVRSYVEAALLAKEAYRVAVPLARRFGIGVGEVVVVGLGEELAQFLFHRVGVPVFVGENLRGDLVQLHRVDCLEEAVGLSADCVRLQSFRFPRHLNGFPGQVGIKRYLVFPQYEAVRGIDVRGGELGCRFRIAVFRTEGIAVIISRLCRQRAWVGHLQAAHLLSVSGRSAVCHLLVQRCVADAEEMLVNQERRIVFVGDVDALLVLCERITGELVVDQHAVLVVILQFQSVIDVV